jgi:cytoskeletal protein CcmA (bactofilin family)
MALMRRDEPEQPQARPPQQQPQVQSAPAPAAPGHEVNTILGRGTEFEGKLTFEGTVRIDGKFSGEIFTNDVLIIGEGAEVRAEIDVATVIVRGHVHGNIRAKHGVELRTPGRVKGNIATPALIIDKGVIFEGQCQMEGVTPGGAQRPERKS